MSKNYMQEIKNRILSSEDGSVFSTSDFADIADTNTVRSALYRLVKDNILRRIINGIYEKPKYSKLLDEYVAADPASVAQALARSYHWTIAPCGNTALNLLGLSTQVTAVCPILVTDLIKPMNGILQNLNSNTEPIKKLPVCPI